MTIRQLRPAKIAKSKITLPQCEFPVDEPIRNKLWAKKGYKAEFCQKEAGIAIGAKCYCRQHAGQIALDKWLKGELTDESDNTVGRG